MAIIKKIKKIKWILLALLFLCNTSLYAQKSRQTDYPVRTHIEKQTAKHLGPNDSLMIIAPNGQIVAAIRENKPLVPASIIKVLTSLAALHYLGPEYRYRTDFFLSPDKDLKIKGYGDPMLVSERLDFIAQKIAKKLETVQNIVLDESYFNQPILIPGRHKSLEPYDAPNGAICVNFNTVLFKKNSYQWVSAEPQTPLLPSVIPKIETSGLSAGRITLAGSNAEGACYAGELIRFFLTRSGVLVKGGICLGSVQPHKDTLVLRHKSDKTLMDVVNALLEFSNNYIANQLLLTIGAKAYGPPATVEKGINALRYYYSSELKLCPKNLVEASGLSRENKISAQEMMIILSHFERYHYLMRKQGRQWYKTGTLKGIKTRAGYLTSKNGGLYRFIVMINTPEKHYYGLMKVIEKNLP
ncbi:MAG: hypothetical protein GY874_24045 [Desulfobacteraceae bacterium]|nr:hypothetical protein [Desulfobacteraceae bacterium]